MIRSPGGCKTLLARVLASIPADITSEHAMDATRVYSAAH
jgi:predicted ATPase with chaperone activity